MRQITKQAVNKFNNNQNFTKDNTRVIYSDISYTNNKAIFT